MRVVHALDAVHNAMIEMVARISTNILENNKSSHFMDSLTYCSLHTCFDENFSLKIELNSKIKSFFYYKNIYFSLYDNFIYTFLLYIYFYIYV